MIDFLMGVRAVGIWIGALPIAACGLLAIRALLFPRFAGPSRAAVQLAAAFGISFAADLFNEALRARGIPNQWVTYVYAPVQFGLLALVVFEPTTSKRLVAAAFALLVATSFATASWVRPEAVIQVVAGAWIGIVALQHPRLGRFRWPVVVYCVGAIPFLLALAAVDPVLEWQWIVPWVGYQAVRVAALVWLTGALIALPYLRTLEVVNDERGGSAARRRPRGRGRADDGRADRIDGRRHLPVFSGAEARRRSASG